MIDVSLIPKKEGKTVSTSINTLVFVLALIILIISVVAGAGFMAWSLSLQGNLGQLNSQLKDLDASVLKQQQTINYAQSILTVENLLKNHKYPSSFLSFLENNTESNVQWVGLGLDLSKGQVSLDGVAKDMMDVAYQLKQFQDSGDATNVAVGSVASINNQISFKITFSLKSF